MKRSIFLFGVSVFLMTACAREIAETPINQEEDVVITATAIASGAHVSKVAYSDNYSEAEEICDITAKWENGDSFTALEINGGTITEVTFSTTGNGSSAEFKSKGAVAANEKTTWLAISGKVTYEDGVFVCAYDGQDGSLDNLGNYDYVVASATGTKPVFDFSEGDKLSYVMRILLPAGIQFIEFNTGTTYNGGWNVSSSGKQNSTTSTTEKAATHMITLPGISGKGEVAYVALPAIDCTIGEGDYKNRVAGIIITIMSSDKKQSQGKVATLNLYKKGGHVGTFDMSGLELIARPLPEEAIKLGNITYEGKTYPLGSWAPFNLGGDYPTSDENIVGDLFAWGEIEPKTSFTKENYRWYNSGTYNTQLGYKRVCAMEGVQPYIEVWYAGGGGLQCGPSEKYGNTFYDIGGTKYDAARVKWGSEWRLPSNEVAVNLLRDGKYSLTRTMNIPLETVEYAPGTYSNSYNYTSTNYGCAVFKANGAELVLYKTPYTDNGTKNSPGTEGRYWTATSDWGTGSGYWNRSVQMRLQHLPEDLYMNNKSWQWDGLTIRAIINE